VLRGGGEIQFCQQNLADSDIQPIFPQLDRPIVLLEPQDQEKKISYEFRNHKVGGYHFVSQMEKRGWQRGSVVDGGMISSYYKNFPDVEMVVFLTTDGIGVGYYDGEVELDALYVVKSGSVKTGSYTYDEPENEANIRLIPFGDIPPVIYSEVMGDLQNLTPKVQEPA